MLSVPKYGWEDPNTNFILTYATTNFSLDEVEYELDNFKFIAVDWIKAAVYGLKNFFRPFTVRGGFYSGDSEEADVFCTVTENFCYIICADKRKILETHFVKMTMIDFCKALHSDISKNTFEWAYFEYYGDEFDDDRYRELHFQTEKIIISLLDKLDALIKERENYFK